VSEALQQLFAETIERRRAALAQVIEPLRDSDVHRIAARVQSEDVARGAGEPAAAATALPALLPEAELRASSEGMFDRELGALLRERKPRIWPWAAGAVAALVAGLGLGAPRHEPAYRPESGAGAAASAPGAATSVAPGGSEQAPAATLPGPAPVPEAAAPPQVATALPPAVLDPERGEISDGIALTASSGTDSDAVPRSRAALRALARAARATPAPRARARATTTAPAAAAVASNEPSSPLHASVLEKNPYLMQR
jgi:hypothetical protein